MTREEKILLAIEKGYTCDPTTGKVYGVRGNEIKAKVEGYTIFRISNKEVNFVVKCHQFVYYWVNKQVVDCIDHINGIRDDNRIDNLRSVTNQQNLFNSTYKGYYYDNDSNKWRAQIRVNGKKTTLGRFNTEKEAGQAYLDAKKIYHII